MTPAKAWFLALRPKTLPLAVTPVMVGSALAHAEGAGFNGGAFAAALLAAMAIQSATNLHNDAADFERGADGPGRLGPRRAVAEGWLGAAAVKRAALAAFALALLLGVYLALVGGWPIVAIGLLSLGAGWGYTGGPRPIAYTPFGELFVLLFFGLAAVGGSYYLHAGGLSLNALLTGLAIGLPAAAVLMVNNYRDLEGDRAAGKRTLAVTVGRPAVRTLYTLALLLPFPLLLPLDAVGGHFPGVVFVALPAALWLVQRLRLTPVGSGLNGVLARTAQYQLLVGLLLSVGLLL